MVLVETSLDSYGVSLIQMKRKQKCTVCENVRIGIGEPWSDAAQAPSGADAAGAVSMALLMVPSIPLSFPVLGELII